MKKTIHIRQPLQVGDTTLAPGEYNLVIDGNEATFQRGRKVVAKVSCALKERGEKSSQDAVIYDNATLTEIRLAGQSQVVTFIPMTRAASPSKSTSSVQVIDAYENMPRSGDSEPDRGPSFMRQRLSSSLC
jgi:hypothetical protein